MSSVLSLVSRLLYLVTVALPTGFFRLLSWVSSVLLLRVMGGAV